MSPPIVAMSCMTVCCTRLLACERGSAVATAGAGPTAAATGSSQTAAAAGSGPAAATPTSTTAVVYCFVLLPTIAFRRRACHCAIGYCGSSSASRHEMGHPSRLLQQP